MLLRCLKPTVRELREGYEMQKPKSCEKCPLYGDGENFVYDKLHEGAEILVIRQFPDQYEASKGEAEIGMNYDEYARDYQKYAGPVAISTSFVVRCRGQRGVKLPQGAKLAAGIKFCRQYDQIQDSIKLVVLQGADVVKALRGDIKDALKWRGFLTPETKEKETQAGGENV